MSATRTPPHRDDHGMALSVWFAAGMLFFVLVLGIGVDFTGKAMAEQDARGVAHEAARAAGQCLLPGTGAGEPAIDTVRANTAAKSYLAGLPYSATIRVTNTVVQITVNTTYRTKFLSVIGVNQLPVHATSEVHAIRAVDGAHR